MEEKDAIFVYIFFIFFYKLSLYTLLLCRSVMTITDHFTFDGGAF